MTSNLADSKWLKLSNNIINVDVITGVIEEYFANFKFQNHKVWQDWLLLLQLELQYGAYIIKSSIDGP